MNPKITIDATRTQYPVTLAQAKAYLRVDTDDEDDEIGRLIKAATRYVEEHTGRLFGSPTVGAEAGEGVKFEVSLDAFPEGDLIMPVAVCTEIDSAVIYKLDDADQTVTLASWIDIKAQPARIVKPSDGWPASVDQVPNAITITAYSETGDSELARSAVLSLAAHWFENREAAGQSSADDKRVPGGLQRVLDLLSFPTF